MNRGVWLGGLVLTLGGWVGGLDAQEVVWRAAKRPAAPPTALPTATPVEPGLAAEPPAALGRPAPLPGEFVAPTRRPVEPLSALAAPSYRVTAPPPPALLPTAAETEAGVAEEAQSLFAVDRIARPPHAPAVVDADFRPAIATIPTDLPPVISSGRPAPAYTEAPPADSPLFYLRGEYLLWRLNKDSVPPLLSTSAPQDFGILGQPTTKILFGGDGLDGGTRSGGRFTAGLWIDPCGEEAVEVTGFWLGSKHENFQANSAFTPVIARPFFSLNRNAEFSQLTAFPNVATGNAEVANTSNLWGLEANLRCKECCGCWCGPFGGSTGYRVDLLGGFRYLDLSESLTITENIQNLPTSPPPSTNIRATVVDRFATENQFYGGQVGADAEFRRGRWYVDVMGKLALGDTHQQLTINGFQVFNNPNGTQQTFTGGLLALSSNIGHFQRDQFSVVPELNLKLGYQVTEHARVFVGYDLLYWSNVIRPGQQVDRVIDETLIPNFPSGAVPAGQNRPAVLFHESSLWANGINFGLEFRY